MRRLARAAAWLGVLGLALSLGPAPGAAAPPGLAPAGPCAGDETLPPLGPRTSQPRRDDPARRAPASRASGDGAALLPGSGPVRLRFSPADVAAPAGPGLGPPAAASLPARGPCDDPGSGCLGPVRPAAPAPPAPARPPAPPVFVDPDPDPGCGGPGFPCERLRP